MILCRSAAAKRVTGTAYSFAIAWAKGVERNSRLWLRAEH